MCFVFILIGDCFCGAFTELSSDVAWMEVALARIEVANVAWHSDWKSSHVVGVRFEFICLMAVRIEFLLFYVSCLD